MPATSTTCSTHVPFTTAPGARENVPATPRSCGVSEPSATEAESTAPVASLAAVTAPARRSSQSTVPSAIAAPLTAPVAILPAITAASASLAPVTARVVDVHGLDAEGGDVGRG